jgi:lactate permease
MEFTQMTRFILAMLPLLVILAGIALFKQSGFRMAVIGLLGVTILAVTYFKTSLSVALAGALYGFLKALGISVAVIFTMLMIFVMKEVGALEVISSWIKKLVEGTEIQALFIGIGFGSFLTSLGVVTPALFPPLLLAMGFSPVASVAIAVLGYDATTSFALLAIPITIPAETFGLDLLAFAWKITLFLPVISVGFSFAILWMLGGRRSIRKGFIPAVIIGLCLAGFCLTLTGINYFSGKEIIPVRLTGTIAACLSMMVLWLFNIRERKKRALSKTVEMDGFTSSLPRMHLLRALSPWLILAGLAFLSSISVIPAFLKNLPGQFEIVSIFDNKSVDLNILSQVYTWILIALLLSLLVLKPTKMQIKNTLKVWFRRAWVPFVTYSVYFSISFIMAWSAMHVVEGKLIPTAFFVDYNMNQVLGNTLAAIFGQAYIFVAAGLGLFGAVVGGSETGSNVMFYGIQKRAADSILLAENQFMTIYSSHAVAGGVASAITPAKINNAVMTIETPKGLESLIMRKHLLIAISLTIVTNILSGLFIKIGL